MRFENKVVFLTGGGGYLGGEAAYQFAKEGASIALCDMNETALNAKVERIQALGAKCYINIGVLGCVVTRIHDPIFKIKLIGLNSHDLQSTSFRFGISIS